MGKAKFRLSAYNLEQLLGLPYGARITEIRHISRAFFPQEFVIYVEHQDLPNIDESSWEHEPIDIYPTWSDKTRREFVDWGIPDLQKGVDYDDVDHEMKLDYDPCG